MQSLHCLLFLSLNCSYEVENGLPHSHIKSKLFFTLVYSFDNNIEATNLLKDIMKENDSILIKASNGMHFEEIVDVIK